MILSIIVPVHNGEKYLEDCLKSIDEIDNIDYECIIIDDGSTDKSSQICKKYTNKNKFKYVYKVNEGVSSARNLGMKKANGEFIMFLDCDDFLLPDAEDNILEAIKYNNDLTIFNYVISYDDKKVPYKFTQKSKDEVVDVVNKIYTTTELNTCWGKLLKRKIIEDHNITFKKELSIGEDQIFMMEYINNLKSAHYISQEVMTYRLNDLSVMNSFDPNVRLEDLEKCYKIMKRTLAEQSKTNLLLGMNYCYFKSITHYFRQFSKWTKFKKYKKIYLSQVNNKFIQEIANNAYKNSNISILKKIEAIIISKKYVFGSIYFYVKGKLG